MPVVQFLLVGFGLHRIVSAPTSRPFSYASLVTALRASTAAQCGHFSPLLHLRPLSVALSIIFRQPQRWHSVSYQWWIIFLSPSGCDRSLTICRDIPIYLIIFLFVIIVLTISCGSILFAILTTPL